MTDIGREDKRTPVVYSDRLSSWKLIVSEPRKAKLFVWKEDGFVFRTIWISTHDVARLKNAVTQSRFFDLSRDVYGASTPDGLERTIKVTDGEKEKEILVTRFDAADILASPSPHEFEQVAELWRIIRSLVPEGRALDHRNEDARALGNWMGKANQALDPIRVPEH